MNHPPISWPQPSPTEIKRLLVSESAFYHHGEQTYRILNFDTTGQFNCEVEDTGEERVFHVDDILDTDVFFRLSPVTVGDLLK